MPKYTVHFIIHFLVISILCGIGYGQSDFFGTMSNVKQRPLAMGGAFTSIEDDLEAVLYNPGMFSLYQNEKDFRVTVFLNPVSLLLAYRHHSSNFQKKISQTNLLNASGLLFKSVIVTAKFLNLGVLLGEQSSKNIQQQTDSRFFQYSDSWNNGAHTLFANLRLAERVSVGASSTLYYNQPHNDRERGYGFSYGIRLKPHRRLNVGLSYIDFPDEIPNSRVILERIFDETMNIGVSYNLFAGTILSMDVRNLTEENKTNNREFHFGFEQRFFKIGALQFGYFRENETKNDYFSAGIGLLDSNLYHKKSNQFSHNNFSIQYSMVYQKEQHKRFNRWHFFSLLLHL